MSGGLLLNTHIALWLDSGNERLAAPTRAMIDQHWRNSGTIALSAASVWEIALLVDSGRLRLDVPVHEWVRRFTARPGIEAIPLNYRAAAAAYDLDDLGHRDPADRLLIATAIELSWPLVTYDDRILVSPRRRAKNTDSPLGGKRAHPNRLERGKPCGTERPAPPRGPRHGVRSGSVRVRLSLWRHDKPSAKRNTLASANPPER